MCRLPSAVCEIQQSTYLIRSIASSCRFFGTRLRAQCARPRGDRRAWANVSIKSKCITSYVGAARQAATREIQSRARLAARGPSLRLPIPYIRHARSPTQRESACRVRHARPQSDAPAHNPTRHARCRPLTTRGASTRSRMHPPVARCTFPQPDAPAVRCTRPQPDAATRSLTRP